MRLQNFVLAWMNKCNVEKCMNNLHLNDARAIYICLCHRYDYAVIRFVETLQPEVVPTNWLMSEHTLKWPPVVQSNSLLTKTICKRHAPEADFTDFEVKILFSTGLLHLFSSINNKMISISQHSLFFSDICFLINR